jgi:segregation and condensation protein B
MSAERALKVIAEQIHSALAASETDRVSAQRARAVRIAEALIFASSTPIAQEVIAARLPEGSPSVADVLLDLRALYSDRGVRLTDVAGGYVFRTAPEIAHVIAPGTVPEPRKLSRAALETLAIIAYHQPVTRAEIEEIRGVATNKGTLDLLMQSEWIRMRGRRRTPGRPVTYGTTDDFLSQFSLASLGDLPGLDELKSAGIVDSRLREVAIGGYSLEEDPLSPEGELGDDALEEAIEERINEALPPLEDEQ